MTTAQIDLVARFERALEAARPGSVATATAELGEAVDPSAIVFATRLASDEWFCFERPGKERLALAAVGVAKRFTAHGEGRFAQLARVVDDLPGTDDLPPGAGPVLVGGFAFWPNGGGGDWAPFPSGQLVLPELSLLRRGDRCFATVSAVAGDEDALRRIRARLSWPGDPRLPLLDPDPAGRFRISDVPSPEAYEAGVAAGRERIRRGEIEKFVLARAVEVQAPQRYDAGAVFGALRESYENCFCFCAGTPEATFIGASPELLVQRRGATLQTVALAASTRRSADPAVDAHLGERLLASDKARNEHEIVADRIVRALTPHAVWVRRTPEPQVVKIANIQHLATPIQAQLVEPRPLLELVGLLHPTPAVGGEPWAKAARVVRDLEPADRGWYAGPLGWVDASGDGEFCVAIRSALLRDRTARLYVGNGIVGDSDPEAELAETEVKLQALLPLLS